MAAYLQRLHPEKDARSCSLQVLQTRPGMILTQGPREVWSHDAQVTQAAHLGKAGLPDEDGGIRSGRAQQHAIWVKLSSGVPCLDSIVRHLQPQQDTSALATGQHKKCNCTALC